jgi:predicted AlkP superfamily phosphohydrolase/phosphomutase
MKLLVIGIDGGTYDILRRMEMPFLNNFFNNNIHIDLEEDLWSRGWAEILNGKHGRESGAFYYKPVLGKPFLTTSHFGPENHEQPPLVPLWKKLGSLGHKVGLFNIPTTMPAPSLNGFCISGAGAGFNPKNGLKPEACYPSNTFSYLQQINFEWQIRFMSSGIKQIAPFFDAVESVIEKRTDAFIAFAKQFQIDFGFIVHTENNPIQNVCMYEIQELLKNSGGAQTELQERIRSFYPILDNSIKKLVENLNPLNIIITSDHGSASRHYSINLNEFLVGIGLQKKLSPKMTIKIIKNVKRFFPESIKTIIKKKAPNLVQNSNRLNIDFKASKAFTQRYIPGIYLNDADRFKGPVSSVKEKQHLINYIMENFQSSKLHLEHHLTAVRPPEKFSTCKFKDIIPDILIDKPSNAFFEGSGPMIEKNRNYRRITSLSEVSQDLYQGVKGKKPLAVIDKNLERYIHGTEENNLTQIYNIICRTMESA